MATIFLSNGNDTRTIVNPGTYTIDALGGIDTLSFGTSLRSVYTITTRADGAVQVDTVSGASAAFHATLYNTEVLLFDNDRDRLEVSSLFGTAGTTLVGTDARDHFEPNATVTSIDGRQDLDTVTLNQTHSSARLAPAADGYTVQTSGGSTLQLHNIERLVFNDKQLALDLQGSAGTVAKTLGAVFGPESVANPALAGVGLFLCDAGTDAAALMQLALDARLGANASATDVVTLLYKNVVGGSPADEVLASLVALLDNQSYTPVTLGLAAAELPMNLERIDFIGLANGGLQFEPWVGS